MAHPVASDLDIGKLLELLNASDEHNGTVRQMPNHHQAASPLVCSKAVLSTDLTDPKENKFAAHIVQGMSKIKLGNF
jgi:hypothetical protein